jgi:hypothetical protein
VSYQHSANIKENPEFFVECNWQTLDYNTRLFGPRLVKESVVGTVDELRPVLRGSHFVSWPTDWLCGLQSRHWITGTK